MANSRKNLQVHVRSTSAQINMLINFMAGNKDFANAQGEYAGVMGNQKAIETWDDLREQLRQHGSDKSVPQWKQTWRDLKAKARKFLRDNKGQVPVVPDTIFKILATIGEVSGDYSMEILTTDKTASEDHDWNEEIEENSHIIESGNEDTKNVETMIDKQSNHSSESEAEDNMDNESSVVEVVVPLPQVKHVYCDRTSNKSLHDPLQPAAANLPRLPQLAPKPSLLNAVEHTSYQQPTYPQHDPQSPTVIRRRKILLNRKRKAQEMFQQVSNDYVSLEQRRLRMEEERDRRLHEREMERLKLELQRIEVQRNHNELLQHLVTIAQNAYELLQRKLQ